MSDFEDNIVGINGNKGREWLANLDSRVKELAQKWNLSNLRPFKNLTFNYVLSGIQDETTPIVLKVGIKNYLLKKEAEALAFFKHYGAVNLIDSCEDALLIQRCLPGSSLMEYVPNRENEAIEITADIVRKLHSMSKRSCDFTTLDELISELNGDHDLPNGYLQKARKIACYLLETTRNESVMHGDLHQDNILRDRNEWKIIDPSPVIGDPIYELTSFMINPIDKLWKYENAQEIIRNRLCKFSQIMRIGSERLAQWTFVKSVLCVIWTKGSAVRRDRIELAKLFDGMTEISD
jgi:streptomycin 6-kinase